MRNKKNNSALSVQEGIPQPESISPYFQKRNRAKFTVDEFVSGITSGNRVILSQAITLIESTNSHDFEIAKELIAKCLPFSGNSLRIGITGVPGVGKSTFIETFGKYITSLGKKIAVLAIDPSSERSKGSILGDKTRMEELAIEPLAFIRPSPSGLTLGGVTRKTRETIILCEAAGFEVILIETVGVGQSETVVKSMVDFFLLLMLSGAGDELQGIKRGIMEMADALIITKADGSNMPSATAAKALYQSALHLFPKNENNWEIPVEMCSVYQLHTIVKVWEVIKNFENHTKQNHFFEKNRAEQSEHTFYNWVDTLLKEHFSEEIENQINNNNLIQQIKMGQISPYQAGTDLISTLLKLN